MSQRFWLHGVVVLATFTGTLGAQEGIQRGKIKKLDVDKLVLTLTVGAQDQDFRLTKYSQVFGVQGKDLKQRLQSLKEGAAVLFKAEKRDGKDVIVGLKLADDSAGAKFKLPRFPPDATDLLFRLLDTNNDGQLSREELQNATKLLEKLDSNKDGMIDLAELRAYYLKMAAKRGGGRPGEIITPAAKGERHKDRLKVGDPAPDFTLPTLKGDDEVTLSSFQGKKPVVLIFASYT